MTKALRVRELVEILRDADPESVVVLMTHCAVTSLALPNLWQMPVGPGWR
ncbi:hypothetical protein OKW42_006706 [Paraburkholderia sp. WC7.3d]